MQSRLVEYARRDSPLQRMDPRWKLAGVVLGCAAIVSLRTPTAAALALAGTLALLLLSRLPMRWFLARLGGVAVFLGLVVVILPLTLPGEEVALGPVRLSARGLAVAALIVLKALALIGLVLLLFATGPVDAVLKAARSLWMPGLLVQLLMLTQRYVRLLADELHKLRIALRLRGYRNRMSRHAYRTISHVTGTLLVRSYERAERVGQAMRCRGFDGSFRSLQTFRTRPEDVALFALVVLLSGGLPLASIYWPPGGGFR